MNDITRHNMRTAKLMAIYSCAMILLSFALSGCNKKPPPPDVNSKIDAVTITRLQRRCASLAEEVSAQSNRADFAEAEHKKELKTNGPLRRQLETLISRSNTAKGHIERLGDKIEEQIKAQRQLRKELNAMQASDSKLEEAQSSSKEKSAKIEKLDEQIQKHQEAQQCLQDELKALRTVESDLKKADVLSKEQAALIKSLEAQIKLLEKKASAVQAAMPDSQTSATN